MTDDTHHPDDPENQPDDHQQAIEACEHAADALRGGDLFRARSLLDEASTAVVRAQHDDMGQAYRETAFDCYE